MQYKVKLDEDFEVVVELKNRTKQTWRDDSVIDVSIDGKPFTIAEREHMCKHQRYRVLVPWDATFPKKDQRYVTVATKDDIKTLVVSWFEVGSVVALMSRGF